MSGHELDPEVVDDCAPAAARQMILDEVTEALQSAEELGGPEGDEYAHLMLDIADVLISRIDGVSSHFSMSAEVYARCRETGDRFREMLRQHLIQNNDAPGV